ncbi:MAG TPA: ISNCY family transposase [Acidobacteriota bacterium]|jgi:IS5 family transposase|nr:ISNCY family transposase [Acidobacteriota bacterium]
MTRTRDPQFSFADLEFLSQNVKLEPVLQAISNFIDQHAELVEKVRRDLATGLKKPATGRNGLTAQQTLRSLTLMRVKNWDYRELRERIADGYTVRRFTHFNSKPVPKHDAFNRAFNRLTPATLQAINNAVVRAAVTLGLEDGKKLRADTTVVETDIHHPTDNTLLWDSVRVITRLVGHLADLLPAGISGFTNRTRSARRRMLEIQRMTSKERTHGQVGKYRQLIGITELVVAGARGVLRKTKSVRVMDFLRDIAIQSLRREIEHYCQLADRVIDQSRRRVLEGHPVANAQKVFSIFEPHTDLIKRGKILRDIEFGHKVFLAESACGLITQYRVLDGNPSDQDQVEAALDRHQKTFRRSPELCSLDRGFFSEKNVQLCQQAGVKVVCIPQCGGKKTPERQAYENSPVFKKGQRFRAGIEGRISVLLRGRGMRRCLAEGRQRFELLVGAAVLANNLMVIAQLLTKKQKRRRHAA